MNRKIILASTSPRRKDILSMLGLDFVVASMEIDESIHLEESPYDYVHRLSIEKAESIVEKFPDAVIIAGDVTIDLDGVALAKAESAEEAKGMLKRLQGRSHAVRDGFAVIDQGKLHTSGVATAIVTFKKLSDEELNTYVSSREWEGKAGAYAIQGDAKAFITDIQGSFYDILGLPIYQIAAALYNLGFTEVLNTLNEIRKIDREKIELTINSKYNINKHINKR